MKVIILSDSAKVDGGAAKVALTSALGLADRGIAVQVLGGMYEPAPQLAAHPGISVRSLGLPHYNTLPVRQRLKAGVWRNDTSKCLSEILNQEDKRSTVVHVHGCRDALTPSVVAVTRDMGFRLVMTAHDYGLGCPYGGFYDYQNNAICPERGLSLGCIYRSCNTGGAFAKVWNLYRYHIQRTRGGLPGKVDRYLFVSEFQRQRLQSYLPKDALHQVLANPIDAERIGRRELQPEAPFVFVGRLTPEKDPITFAQAAHAAKVKALFIGEGPEMGNLKRVCPDAEYPGWLASHQVADRLRRARALVFPSAWLEAQPLVPEEAAAHGLPILCSDANAGRETVERLNCGKLFPARDAVALADLLREFSQPAVSEPYSENAFNHYWEDPYTLDRHLDRLMQVYQEVLAA